MPGPMLRACLGATAFALFCAPYALAADETGAATADDPSDPATHDPIESINRAIFEVNGVFYEVSTPLVEATPDPIRGLFKAIGTAAAAPVRLITTIATDNQSNEHLADIARENEVDCGFFVVLPFAGPTTSRDAVGTGVEIAGNIAAGQIIYLGAGAAAHDRIDAEVEIRQLDGAVDKYALARSATLQDRGCVVVEEGDAPTAFGEEPRGIEEASEK